MDVDPSMDFVRPSDGVPFEAILASVFFTTRYLLLVARIFSRSSVSCATVMPLNCATIRFVASARSFFSAFSSCSFFFFGFMLPLLCVQSHKVQINAGTHGRSDRNALHITTLDCGRTHLDDGIDKSLGIFAQLLTGKLNLANWRMDNACLVDPELH